MVGLPVMIAWRSGSAMGDSKVDKIAQCSGSTIRYGGFASNDSLALWERHG
jgi:hypothetical protein